MIAPAFIFMCLAIWLGISRTHFSPFQINTHSKKKITKWPPAAILDDQKSLSIAFLAISYQYATFCFDFFFKMTAGAHFGSPICAKNNRVLPLLLSMAMPNMQLIGEFMTC